MRRPAALVDALDHAIGEEVAGAAGAHDVDHRAQVDARLGRDRQHLERDPGRGEGEQAVHQLRRVAEAERAEVEGRAAELLEQRLARARRPPPRRRP